MGYIEETGAAQYLRDARIAPIYEGTNGIQAADLVARKIGRDGGEAARVFLAEIEPVAAALAGAGGQQLPAIGRQLAAGLAALREATQSIVTQQSERPAAAAAAATPYLRLLGIVAGGFLMAKAALAASRALGNTAADSAFLRAKIATAHFYADHFLSQAPALVQPVVAGSDSVLDFADEEF
jgi:hypothetical protein